MNNLKKEVVLGYGEERMCVKASKAVAIPLNWDVSEIIV